MQEKDSLIEQCLKSLSPREQTLIGWNPILNQLELAKLRLKVQLVRRGKQTMLENMFLAKQKFEEQNPHVFYQSHRRAA